METVLAEEGRKEERRGRGVTWEVVILSVVDVSTLEVVGVMAGDLCKKVERDLMR